MLEGEKDVNVEEEVTPSPSPEEPEPQEPVNDQPEGAEPSAGEPTTPEPGKEPQQAPAPTQGVATETHDEHGVPWKNRAVEASRRLQDVELTVVSTVEKTLEKQNKKEVYTRENIPALRKFAKDNPEHEGWVEQQIEDIRAREIATTIKTEVSAIDKKRSDDITRQQAESWITSDPVFKECFVEAAGGGKQWSQTNQLSIVLQQVLNTPDPLTGKLIKDRPDAFFVAAEIAYGRYARMNLQKGSGQVNKLKKDLAKVNRLTVAQAGGKSPAAAPLIKRPVQAALDKFKKSNSKDDLQAATRAHLQGLGILKEE